MINGFLLFLIVCALSAQNILKKAFGLRVTGGVYSFSAISVCFALLVFILTSGGQFHFSFSLFLYSLGFAVAYCTAVVSSMQALLCGSLSLTALICQYALIIPTFYGIFFLSEKTDLLLFIGLLLLFISLLLTNLSGKKEKKPSLRWVLFVSLAFLGNGFCSTFQTAQQNAFDGQYRSEFMIMALVVTLLFLLAVVFLRERKEMKAVLQKGTGLGAFCGLFNGLVNFLVLYLAPRMSASVMFPVIAAGGVALTALVAIAYYREKLSARQWVGVVLGMGAIVLLNLYTKKFDVMAHRTFLFNFIMRGESLRPTVFPPFAVRILWEWLCRRSWDREVLGRLRERHSFPKVLRRKAERAFFSSVRSQSVRGQY